MCVICTYVYVYNINEVIINIELLDVATQLEIQILFDTIKKKLLK